MNQRQTASLPGHSRVRICADIAGSGPPLLLVHGTSADRARWAPLLPHLTDRFTCYAIDRRGRGGSGDGPPEDTADAAAGDAYSIAWEFADIAALAEDLAGRHGAPVNVFAHSYGALVSLHAAALTGHIGRLALYEPPIPTAGPVTPPAILEELKGHAARGDRDAVLETFGLKVVRYPQAEFDMVRSLPAWENRRAAALTIPRELGAIDTEVQFDAARFRDFPVPTLLLLGSDSPDFLQAATHLLAETLPDVRLEVMAGQQHNAIDQIPAAVAELIKQGLSGGAIPV